MSLTTNDNTINNLYNAYLQLPNEARHSIQNLNNRYCLLPRELHRITFEYVSLIDWAAIDQTCKFFHKIINEILVEKVFKELRGVIPLHKYDLLNDRPPFRLFVTKHLRKRVENHYLDEETFPVLVDGKYYKTTQKFYADRWKNNPFSKFIETGLKTYLIPLKISKEKRPLVWDEKQPTFYSKSVIESCKEFHKEAAKNPITTTHLNTSWLYYDSVFLKMAIEQGAPFSEKQAQNSLSYAVLTNNKALTESVIELHKKFKYELKFDLKKILEYLKDDRVLKPLIANLFTLNQPELLDLILPAITGKTEMSYKELLQFFDKIPSQWLSWTFEHIIINDLSDHSSKFFNLLLDLSCKNNNTKYLDLLVNHEYYFGFIIYKICLRGDNSSIPFLQEQKERIKSAFNEEDTEFEEQNGTNDFYFDLPISIQEESLQCYLFTAAAQGGSCEIFETLRGFWDKQELNWEEDMWLIYPAALASGQEPMLTLINNINSSLEKPHPQDSIDSENNLVCALQGGNWDFLQNAWSEEIGGNLDKKNWMVLKPYRRCLKKGDLRILTFLKEKCNFSPPANSLQYAFKSGDLEKIKFVIEDFAQNRPHKLMNLLRTANKYLPERIKNSDQELGLIYTYLNSVIENRQEAQGDLRKRKEPDSAIPPRNLSDAKKRKLG